MQRKGAMILTFTSWLAVHDKGRDGNPHHIQIPIHLSTNEPQIMDLACY